MRLAAAGRPHLTYCTNIHAGETWGEVRGNLERYVVAVKARVAPDRPFGVGLRLSALAAAALAAPGALEAFREWLDARGLYVFTINGFPYGAFHGTRVKEAVYRPHWADEARVAYTDRLASLLAGLLPDGVEGTVSTVPGGFRTPAADLAGMADGMLRHAAGLHALRERTGRTVALAVEPEPFCVMETVAETIAFFEGALFSKAAVARFEALTGLQAGEAEAVLRRHLAVCFDACHMAVEFEPPDEALRAFASAGIRIGKVQVSAGLRVALGGDDRAALEALRDFADGVYLHQVVERRGGRLTRYLDLPEALAAAQGDRGRREWRVHFHVPLFRERLGPFENTQGYLRDLLAILAREPVCPHLEVETYTWDVLPAEHRQEDIVTAVAREVEWAAAHLTP